MPFSKTYSNMVVALMALLVCNLSYGQHRVSYKPLRCAGQIPRDFLELSSEKVFNERAKISDRNLSRKEKKLERDFALNSNFSVDAILYSGKVLYGDVTSEYINKVADKVLEHDKALRSELRFYVLKAGSVNAFSTSQGIIFVSIGLISQVENEAQLAFILCHEISHYVKKHSLEGYKRKNDIIRGRGKFKQLDFEDRIKEVYNYSRENEIEADREGLKLFLKTTYDPAAVVGSFDVLLYSYLPYDEIEWRTSELQDSFYKFPGSYTPSKGKEISANEDEDDEESTHPNIRKRKAEIVQLLEKNKAGGSDLFLHGLDYFNFIQQQARIEMFFILINQAQYEKTYYLTYLYKKTYRDTAYASRIAAYCIYAKATKQLSDEESSGLSVSRSAEKEKEEGASYYVSYFFDKLKKDELAVLSVRMAWEAYVLDRNDSFHRNIFEESAKNLFRYTDLVLNDFITAIDTVTVNTTDSLTDKEENTASLSKVEKLKLKQKEQAGKKKNGKDDKISYKMYAFLEAFADDDFRKVMEKAYETWKHEEDADEEADDKADDYYGNTVKWHKKFGYPGNIDSLILVNPTFSSITIGRRKKRDPIFDERQEMEMSATYMEMAGLNNVYVDPLNLLDKQNLTTEKLNEYAQIMEWMTERLNNFSSGLVLYNSGAVSPIIKNRGTSNLCLSGISYVVEKPEFKPGAMILSAFFAPTFPFYLYFQLHKSHYFTMTNVVFDLKTGQLVYLVSDEFNVSYRKKDYIENLIYALFNQIKTKNQ
jgi:Zn-dependent protease with chaperone function